MDEASRCGRAMSGAGGIIGSQAKIARMTRERSFIAFTPRGALFDSLQERGARIGSRCFKMPD